VVIVITEFKSKMAMIAPVLTMCGVIMSTGGAHADGTVHVELIVPDQEVVSGCHLIGEVRVENVSGKSLHNYNCIAYLNVSRNGENHATIPVIGWPRGFPKVVARAIPAGGGFAFPLYVVGYNRQLIFDDPGYYDLSVNVWNGSDGCQSNTVSIQVIERDIPEYLKERLSTSRLSLHRPFSDVSTVDILDEYLRTGDPNEIVEEYLWYQLGGAQLYSWTMSGGVGEWRYPNIKVQPIIDWIESRPHKGVIVDLYWDEVLRAFSRRPIDDGGYFEIYPYR
jgi:hypothetical protein